MCAKLYTYVKGRFDNHSCYWHFRSLREICFKPLRSSYEKFHFFEPATFQKCELHHSFFSKISTFLLFYRTFIELLSNFYRKFIEHLFTFLVNHLSGCFCIFTLMIKRGSTLALSWILYLRNYPKCICWDFNDHK